MSEDEINDLLYDIYIFLKFNYCYIDKATGNGMNFGNLYDKLEKVVKE